MLIKQQNICKSILFIINLLTKPILFINHLVMIDPNEKKKGLNNFARYSSISFQMIVVIGVFAFAGYKIDAYRETKTPIFTAALSLIGVGVAMYQVVKQLNKNEP